MHVRLVPLRMSSSGLRVGLLKLSVRKSNYSRLTSPVLMDFRCRVWTVQVSILSWFLSSVERYSDCHPFKSLSFEVSICVILSSRYLVLCHQQQHILNHPLQYHLDSCLRIQHSHDHCMLVSHCTSTIYQYYGPCDLITFHSRITDPQSVESQ